MAVNYLKKAIKNGSLNIIKFLVEKDKLKKQTHSFKIFEYCFLNFKPEIAEYFLKKIFEHKEEIDLNKKFDVNKTSLNLLQFSVKYGYLNLIKILKQHQNDFYKINFEIKASSNFNLLHLAAIKKENNLVIDYLIKELKFDIDSINDKGRTPLIVSINYKNLENFKKFLDFNANVNKSDDTTPLQYAIKNMNMKMIKILIKNDANPDKTNKKNENCFHFCGLYGNKEILSLLLEKGKMFNHKNYLSLNPIFYCLKNKENSIELIELFFNVGLPIDSKDIQNNNYLMYYVNLYLKYKEKNPDFEINKKLIEFLKLKGVSIYQENDRICFYDWELKYGF